MGISFVYVSSVHLSSTDQCLILDTPDQMYITQAMASQGLSTLLVDQRSSPTSHLEHDLQHQLQRQQQQAIYNMRESMQMHLHHYQQQRHHESHELLAHMQQQQQQGQAVANAHVYCLHLPSEEKILRRQLSSRQDGLAPISASSLVQETNDWVVGMNMSVLQPQHSSTWPAGLTSSSPLSNGANFMGLSSSSPLSSGANGISEHELLQTSCLQGGSVVAPPIRNPLERFGDPIPLPMLLPRPVYLPEPPEANLQVMLNSLPEKGKLLQAVIQASLLQPLLLASPLPQWRHPPPPLDVEDIPRVSINATGSGSSSGRANMPPGTRQVMRVNSTSWHSSPLRNGVVSLTEASQPSPKN